LLECSSLEATFFGLGPWLNEKNGEYLFKYGGKEGYK